MKTKIVITTTILILTSLFPLVSSESSTIKSWDTFDSALDETWTETVDSDWTLYNDSGVWKYKWTPTESTTGISICKNSATIRSQTTLYVNIQEGEFGEIFAYINTSNYYYVCVDLDTEDVSIRYYNGLIVSVEEIWEDVLTSWTTETGWNKTNDSIVKMYYNGYSGDLKWKIWNVDWPENNPETEPDNWTIEYQSNNLKITTAKKLGLYTNSSSSIYFGNFMVNGLYYDLYEEKPVLYPQKVTSTYVDVPETITEMSFDPLVKYVEEGETFEVNLTLTTFLDVAGYQANIVFNNSLITVNSVTDGGMFNMFLGSNISNENGTIDSICAVEILGNVSGHGVLATINMTAKDTHGICNLNLTNIILSNSELYHLYCGFNNGLIYVNETITNRDLTKNQYDVSSFMYDQDSSYSNDTIYIESYWAESYDLYRTGFWDGYGLIFEDDFLFLNVYVTPDSDFDNTSSGDRIIVIFDVDDSETLTDDDIKFDVWAEGIQQSNGVNGTWYIYNNSAWEQQNSTTFHSSVVFYLNGSLICYDDTSENTSAIVSRTYEDSVYCYKPYQQWTFAISLSSILPSSLDTFLSKTNGTIGVNLYGPNGLNPDWSWSHWNETNETFLSGYESDVEDLSTFGKIILNTTKAEEEEEQITTLNLVNTSEFSDWGVTVPWDTWFSNIPRYKIDLTKTEANKVTLPASYNYTILIFDFESTFSSVIIFEWDGTSFNQLSVTKTGTRTYMFTTDEDTILVVPNPSWTDTEGWYNSFLGKKGKMG